MLEQWLERLNGELTDRDAPLAVNLIVHKSNGRLAEDLALYGKYRVPVIIISLGAQAEVTAAVHGYGGIVLHDVIDNDFAKEAIEKGADGLIAVAAGAGGHAGLLSPFALVQEIRQWFDGPFALSGSIANGGAVLAAQAMGADLAYVDSAFIATDEDNAEPAYKQMLVDSSARDIVYSSLFTGVHGSYLRGSILRAGLNPDDLPVSEPSAMDFAEVIYGAKAWRDIWELGQGIGAIDAAVPAPDLIARLKREYDAARNRLCSSLG